MLAVDTILTAALLSLGALLVQFFNSGIHFWHVPPYF
jgi:hypothetical protein